MAVVHIKQTNIKGQVNYAFNKTLGVSYTLIQYPFSCKTYTRKTQCNSWPHITLSIPGCNLVIPTPRQGADTHPTGSLEDLTKEARSLLAASLANSSKLAYRRTWQMLLQRFPEVSSLPLSPAILCNFIAHLFCNGYSPNSISTHVSAVSYVHKILGLSDTTNTFFVRKILQGCHHSAPNKDSRLPITAPILSR